MQRFKKDKAIQFQHKHSNLLPRRQSPPSPRVVGTTVTSFPAKSLNYHISRTRHTRIPLFAPNWDLVSPILYTKNHAISYTGSLRIWPVFVPLWSGRGRAGKKVTAVTFFRCDTWGLQHHWALTQIYGRSSMDLWTVVHRFMDDALRKKMSILLQVFHSKSAIIYNNLIWYTIAFPNI